MNASCGGIDGHQILARRHTSALLRAVDVARFKHAPKLNYSHSLRCMPFRQKKQAPSKATRVYRCSFSRMPCTKLANDYITIIHTAAVLDRSTCCKEMTEMTLTHIGQHERQVIFCIF